MGRNQNDGVKMTNFEPIKKMFHVHKSAIEGNDFKDHVNFYTGPAPSEDFVTLYTALPKREWVGLTEQDVHDAFQFTELIKQLSFDRERPEWCENFAAYIEAKLKEKNT